MKRFCGFLAIGTIACVLAPHVLAQAGGNLPAIRIGTREVLVPTSVWAKVRGSDYQVLHLGGADFHLFEDGKEQKVTKVTLEGVYLRVFQDNLGVQLGWAYTPNGKWMRLSETMFDGVGSVSYYRIAYEPPPSPEGSCHQIKIKVDPRDATGNRLTIAEDSVSYGKRGVQTDRVEVDRRNLLILSRTEYCTTEHSSSDPLNGTKVSKQMEDYASGTKASESGLTLRAIDLYDESGAARVQLALDFPSIGSETGIPSFRIALLGIVQRSDGALVARFSDTDEAGCPFAQDTAYLDARICRENIPNHYETQIHLLPEGYDLRVVLNYAGALRRVEVPVTVENNDGKHLAVSGIVLCRRFHQHWEPTATSVPPTMPFEFVPLVSKGIEFTPTGDTRFKKKEPMIAYFEVLEPLLAGTGPTRVQFQMRITDVKTGEVKSDTGLRPSDSYIQTGKTVIPIAEQIAIHELPSGTYRLEVQASDSAGKSTVWRAASFTIE